MIELSNDQDQKILNSTVYDALGWSRQKFINVRQKLINEGVLTYEGHYTKFINFDVDGRAKPAHTIFISYAHRDEGDKDELLKHLAPLVRSKLIQTWHDRKMKAGDKIDHQISLNLEKSDVILLLVSADFLNSEYCYSNEMILAVERNKMGTAIVIPVILRHCYWHEAPFFELLAATKDAKPVSDYKTKDEAFCEIVESIRSRLTN